MNAAGRESFEWAGLPGVPVTILVNARDFTPGGMIDAVDHEELPAKYQLADRLLVIETRLAATWTAFKAGSKEETLRQLQSMRQDVLVAKRLIEVVAVPECPGCPDCDVKAGRLPASYAMSPSIEGGCCGLKGRRSFIWQWLKRPARNGARPC
jgi:hypothetical protein